MKNIKEFFKLHKKNKKKEVKEEIKINKEQIKEIKDVDPINIENKHPIGLTSQLKEVNERLDLLTKDKTKKKNKEFNVPNKIKRQLKKLALKNKLMVILLTRNRGMIPMITEIKDGFININGTPHQCSPDFIYLWKGKYPSIVLPEWDLNPIGTKDYYDAVKDKRVADPIAIAIRMMENRESIMKNKLSPKVWIFIGLAIIAGLYVLLGGA